MGVLRDGLVVCTNVVTQQANYSREQRHRQEFACSKRKGVACCGLYSRNGQSLMLVGDYIKCCTYNYSHFSMLNAGFTSNTHNIVYL